MKQILSNDIINQYLPTLIKCPLFNKLGEPELRSYLNNAKVIVHSYKKNDFIALSGDPMEGIGVILEGSALLTRENVMGQRVIMANLEQSDIFGEALLFSKQPYGLLRLKLQRLVKLCSFLLKHLLIHCLIANNAKQNLVQPIGGFV